MPSKDLLRRVFKHYLAIVRRVVDAILSFLGKTAGFVTEHTWALTCFVAGHIGIWLMQK